MQIMMTTVHARQDRYWSISVAHSGFRSSLMSLRTSWNVWRIEWLVVKKEWCVNDTPKASFSSGSAKNLTVLLLRT